MVPQGVKLSEENSACQNWARCKFRGFSLNGRKSQGIARYIIIRPFLWNRNFRRIPDRSTILFPTNSSDFLQFILKVCSQKVLQRIDTLIEQHKVYKGTVEDLPRKSARMESDKTDGILRALLADEIRRGGCTNHARRPRIGILPIHDETERTEVQLFNAFQIRRKTQAL